MSNTQDPIKLALEHARRVMQRGHYSTIEERTAVEQAIAIHQSSVQPCGHPESLLLKSAETGEPLYCEACDDKSGRRDAEMRETELLETNRQLRAEIAALQSPAPQPPKLAECRYGNNGYACCEGGPCQAEAHNDATAPQPQHCEYCDGTGDVHDAAGEWRGRCTCVATQPPGDAREAFEAWANNDFYDGIADISDTWNEERGLYTDASHHMAWHAWQAAQASTQVGEPSRPDILEKLTYHALERDDLTLDECLEYLAAGWRKVHGRTERQMVMQLTALLAGQPVSEQPVLTDDMVTAAARVLNARLAEACNVNADDQWKIHGDDFKADARAALQAAHGIPAPTTTEKVGKGGDHE